MPEEHERPEYPDDEMENGEEDKDIPFDLPQEPTPKSTDEMDKVPASHALPTMPVFREPGVPDPKKTLPDSGGMDPNPDFEPLETLPHEEIEETVPNEAARITALHQPVRIAEDQPEHQPYQRPDYQQPGRQSGLPPSPPGNGQQSGQPRRLPRRRRKRSLRPGCLWIALGIIVTFCGGLTLFTVVMGITLGSRLEEQLSIRIDAVDDYQNFQSTFIFDRNGQLLREAFGEGKRTNVDYSAFPQQLIEATISIEDDTFFSNPGVDLGATFVAFMNFVGANQEEGPGGSTITQQLVRNVLFDFEYRAERSIQRKVEEIMLAMLLTQRKSKEEILALYLNEIYYGNLAYGAQSAAQTFFGKDAGELTLGEAAMLAGLPQAPAELDPLNPDPEVQAAVELRWRQVLNEMVEEGYISSEERDSALRDGITFVPPEVSLEAPHFTVYAQQELEQLTRDLGYTPDDIARGGLKVYTTLDLRVNQLSQIAVRNQIAQLTAKNVSNGAVVVIKPISGEILAMIGSVDYNNDAIDGRVNVTTALRQPGSTMKPFTYSAALEQGMTPGDVIWDTRTTIGIPGLPAYTPVNYDGSFHGPMRMRYALANSYNVPAVQTLRRVGVDYLLALMHRFGADSLGTDASLYGLSLTLGGGEISPVELTQAFAVFANQGVLVPTTSILCILDSDDNIIYQYENGCPRGAITERTVLRNGLGRQVLDPRIAFIISDILSDNAARSTAMGSNSALRTDGIHTSVKTGTTNDVKDNWTVGFTRNVAVGVWVGNSNGDPMINSSGLTGAAPIWNTVITGIYNNQNLLASFATDGQLLTDQPSQPPGLTLRRLCDIRQMSDPATGCGATIVEWFLDGPAGIPDADGNLQYTGPVARPQQQVPPASGPWLQEYEPGVYRVLVHPLPPDISAAINISVGPGQSRPPAPLYCQVPVELAATDPQAREQLFIAPPPTFNTAPNDAIAAEEYARNRGLAYLPTIACTPELIAAQNLGPQVVTAVITSPTPGQIITEGIPVIGTVQFNSDQAEFYALEIQGGQFPNWTVIGELHFNSVTNGQLEFLAGKPGLIVGDYLLRLVLIKNAQQIQAPYVVPFSVR